MRVDLFWAHIDHDVVVVVEVRKDAFDVVDTAPETSIMEDKELAEIRARRMAELQAQQGVKYQKNPENVLLFQKSFSTHLLQGGPGSGSGNNAQAQQEERQR